MCWGGGRSVHPPYEVLPYPAVHFLVGFEDLSLAVGDYSLNLIMAVPAEIPDLGVPLLYGPDSPRQDVMFCHLRALSAPGTAALHQSSPWVSPFWSSYCVPGTILIVSGEVNSTSLAWMRSQRALVTRIEGMSWSPLTASTTSRGVLWPPRVCRACRIHVCTSSCIGYLSRVDGPAGKDREAAVGTD